MQFKTLCPAMKRKCRLTKQLHVPGPNQSHVPVLSGARTLAYSKIKHSTVSGPDNSFGLSIISDTQKATMDKIGGRAGIKLRRNSPERTAGLKRKGQGAVMYNTYNSISGK